MGGLGVVLAGNGGSWGALGRALGESWRVLGVLWAVLEASWGATWGCLGASWGLLEASWGLLEVSWCFFYLDCILEAIFIGFLFPTKFFDFFFDFLVMAIVWRSIGIPTERTIGARSARIPIEQ